MEDEEKGTRSRFMYILLETDFPKDKFQKLCHSSQFLCLGFELWHMGLTFLLHSCFLYFAMIYSTNFLHYNIYNYFSILVPWLPQGLWVLSDCFLTLIFNSKTLRSLSQIVCSTDLNLWLISKDFMWWK